MEDEKLIFIADVEDNSEVESNQEDSSIVVNYELVTDESVELVQAESSVEQDRFNENSLFGEQFVRNVLLKSNEIDKNLKYIDRYLVYENELNDLLSTKAGGNRKNAKKLQSLSIKYNSLDDIHFYKNDFLNESNFSNNEWYIYSFDVGRGDSSLVVTSTGNAYVFDCGDRKQNVHIKIASVLKKHGVQGLNGIFISHPDNDHFGGLIDVLYGLNLLDECFIYYNYLYNSGGNRWTKTLNVIRHFVSSGNLKVFPIPKKSSLPQKNILLGLPSSFYWPHSNLKFCRSYRGAINKNDSSHGILLGIENEYLFNFFGDFEKKAWKELIKSNIDKKISNTNFIFKYPHHGRKSGNPILNKKSNKTVRELFNNYNVCNNQKVLCYELASSNTRSHFSNTVCKCWPKANDIKYTYKKDQLVDIQII